MDAVRAIAISALATAVVAVLLHTWQSGPAAPSEAVPPPAARAILPGPSTRPALPVAGVRDPARFGRWLEEESSLRGTELDGAWDVDVQGRFTPTIALRRRFDQLLTLVGEATAEEIGGFIAREVRDWGGPAAEAQVMDAWRRYLALQRHSFRQPVRLGDRETLLAALAERQQVRRQILGDALSRAFFAQDEAALQAMLQGQGDGAAADDATLIDRRQLDEAALHRLQQEDAAWADWQRRLDAARLELQALRAAPQWSDAQRQEAIERLLSERFTPREAVRVRALLQLPPVL